MFFYVIIPKISMVWKGKSPEIYKMLFFFSRMAGLPSEKIVEAHGSFHESHCIKCDQEYDSNQIKKIIFEDKIPKCEKFDCPGIVKPDIVFFGEALPKDFENLVPQDFPEWGTNLAKEVASLSFCEHALVRIPC